MNNWKPDFEKRKLSGSFTMVTSQRAKMEIDAGSLKPQSVKLTLHHGYHISWMPYTYLTGNSDSSKIRSIAT